MINPSIHIDQYKNNRIQNYIAFIALLGLIIGFVASRGLLSVSCIILFANTLWTDTFKYTFSKFKKNIFCLTSIVYFIYAFISGIWSEDYVKWFESIVDKLPFLTLPIGLISLPFHNNGFRYWFITSLNTIINTVIIISLYLFIKDYDQYVNAYQHSKLIPTIASGDHIRFGLFLAINFLINIRFLKNDQHLFNKFDRIFIIFSTVLIFIYLHILSAKTGLLCLYGTILLLLWHVLSKKMNIILAFIIPIVSISILSIIAYNTVSTFQQKVNYVTHELEHIASGKDLNYNYSDMGRIISYDIALKKVAKSPILGTGIGDLFNEMDKGYDKYYPEVHDNSRFVPINQYLLELMSLGIFGLLIFIVLSLSPFTANLKLEQIYLNITTIIMIFSMNVEAMLQLQEGVFIYLFLTCIWFALSRYQYEIDVNDKYVNIAQKRLSK